MPTPQSTVSWLQKIRDGVVFSEGFENDNFISADGWTVLQGSPANSSAQYKDGIKSWDNSANAQSLPVAKKIITDMNIDLGTFGFGIGVWFYDTGDTTSPGPYFKIKTTDGKFWSIGVRNSVSTTNYSYAAGSIFGDQPTTATSVNRSVGWHHFFFYITGMGSVMNVSLDGGAFSIAGTSSFVSEIYLCADTVGGGGPSFGFFDDVTYFRNIQTQINYDSSLGDGWTKVYDSGNNLVSQSVNSNPSALNLFNTVYPFFGFIEFGDETTTVKLILRSPLMQINPGDIYLLNSIQLGRKLTAYKPLLASKKNVNESTSGVEETIFNANKNKLSFGVKNLDGLALKEQVDEWFNYADQGGVFSILVEDQNNGFGVISAALAPNGNTATIMSNLYTNPTDPFTVGRQYVIFDPANTRRQTVTLASKTSTVLTFAENIKYPFQPLDYICDLTFHPFLELGTNKYGLQMVDERYVRFNWNQAVQEYNGG